MINSIIEKLLTKYEKLLVAVILLSITIVFLFPAFLGKIDTPVDVRDVIMYPWRYHAVDKKIKKIDLWQVDLSKQNKPTIIPLHKVIQIKLKPDFGKQINDLTKNNFYISFDFRTSEKIESILDIKGFIVDEQNGKFYSLPYTITPVVENNSGYSYAVYLSLNSFLQNLDSFKSLANYHFVIYAQNNSSSENISLSFGEVKLIKENFSTVKSVHNYYINDLVQMFTPFREYYSKSIKDGHLPFWNNFIFSGTEFLAEPQLGYLHPLYFIAYFIFDHFTAHEMITLLCFFLGGFGAFLFSKHIGLGFIASLFTSIVYMFQPFNITWFSYEHMLMNSATLPFLLIFYGRSLTHKKLINRDLLLSALLLGLIFLSGHLQYVYYTVIFFFLYAMFKIVVNRNNLSKHLFNLIFALFFALMISSVVLIPFFSLFPHSHRLPNSEAFIRANSFPLKGLLGLFHPYYGGKIESGHTDISKLDPNYVGGFFNNYIYFGFLPLLFFVFGFSKILTNKLVLFLTAVIIFSFLICTGSPVYSLLKNILPGFKEMQHYRFLQLYSYSVPFLAGIGFQAFLKKTSFIKSKLKFVLVTVIFFVTIIDLFYFSSFFITWSDRKDYKPIPQNGGLEFLVKEIKKSKESFRVLPFSIDKVGETKLKVNIAQPNTLLPYGLEDVSGYSSFVPKDIYNLLVYIQTKDLNKLYQKKMINLFVNPNIPFPIYNFKSKILDLLNVKYFIVPSVITIDSSEAKKVYDGDCGIYENKGYLPRAFFVENYKVIKDSKDIIIALDSPGFDPRKEVILMEEPYLRVGTLHATSLHKGIRNEIDVKYHPNKIILHTKTSVPGFVVLGNNLNNNWKVKINGKEGRHYQANLVQRAVYVPKARSYTIEFYYYPKLFFIGFSLSLLSGLILLILTIYLRFSKRNDD